MEATTTERTEQAEEIAFISKSTDLRIVVYTPYPEIRNQLGQVVTPGNYGFIPQFEDGKLTTQMLREQAERAEVEDVEQAVTHAIKKIRETPSFNTAATNGIWQLGEAPDEAKPTVDQQNQAIAVLTAHQNIEGLEELIEAEEATHNRGIVIRAAASSIAAIHQANSPEEAA